jgi:hypothetical protein
MCEYATTNCSVPQREEQREREKKREGAACRVARKGGETKKGYVEKSHGLKLGFLSRKGENQVSFSLFEAQTPPSGASCRGNPICLPPYLPHELHELELEPHCGA